MLVPTEIANPNVYDAIINKNRTIIADADVSQAEKEIRELNANICNTFFHLDISTIPYRKIYRYVVDGKITSWAGVAIILLEYNVSFYMVMEEF